MRLLRDKKSRAVLIRYSSTERETFDAYKKIQELDLRVKHLERILKRLQERLNIR